MALFSGVNHVGYVVSDLDIATSFFVDVLGFERVVERAGLLGDPDGELMSVRFGVHPRATGEFRFFKSGDALVELLQWQAPDHDPTPARNSNLSGRHLAVSTSDTDAATAAIGAFGGSEIREPNAQGYIYVKTPFGLELQLIPVQE